MKTIYTLMHKDIEVLTFSLHEHSKWAILHTMITPEHAPLNMIERKDHPEKQLNTFLDHRTIPESRENRIVLQEFFDTDNLLALSLRSMMTSIADHYWVKPTSSTIRWSEVSFFHNHFSDEPIYVSSVSTHGLAKAKTSQMISQRTPNTSNNGSLPQMWIQEKDSIYLYKAGTRPLKQQPINEAIVSDLLDLLQVPHTPYHLGYLDDENVSICPCFTSDDIEFIPAWQVTAAPKPNDKNDYQHYLYKLEELGISHAREGIDQMIAIDFLINNEDRHWGNFGILRNSTTLEAIGLAPIFDNGSSLLYLSPYETSKIPRGQDLSKAFRKHHVDEIELIKPPLNMPIEHLLDSLESILENGYNQLIHPIFPKDRIMNLKHMLVGQIDKLIKYTD